MRRLSGRNGRVTVVVISLLVAVSLTGCVQNAQAEARGAGILSEDFPDGLTAEGVVLAAVLLSTADISAAVAEGLVSPSEVDAAKEAIDKGTLDFWRQRAEADQSQ